MRGGGVRALVTGSWVRAVEFRVGKSKAGRANGSPFKLKLSERERKRAGRNRLAATARFGAMQAPFELTRRLPSCG